MSVQNPAYTVTRWSVVGLEAAFSKMFDPPTESPAPTDQVLVAPQGLIRPNPVPEVMFAAGLQSKPAIPHTVSRDLLLSQSIPTWDGAKRLVFYTIGDNDNPASKGGTFPGPTLRMPRGVIFSADVSGKGPPPHTIHWHGTEPTPLNDGVGHCSMELGHYIYQWQPNFMGFYFIHCHRNTMQHFEFGLYSANIIEAPDAYFASIASSTTDNAGNVTVTLNSIPIGHGRDGKRRVACNLDNPLTGQPRFTQFPGFNRRPVDSPDDQPLGPNDTNIRFATDPHAMTVPFDVESLLVFDDRDSVWSDLAPGAFTSFPKTGLQPGINDEFQSNPGTNGFLSFNDFNADYWYVTGVAVPAHKGGVGTIPPNIVIPANLNSGISGTQISVNATTGDVILVRILNAAYNYIRVTLPVDAVIIAWDGRALGVAPFGHNESYLVPAGTPIDTGNMNNIMSVGRRFDCLIKSNTPVNDFIVVDFINNKSMLPEAGEKEEIMVTARVPFTISGTPLPPQTFTFRGSVFDELGTPLAGYNITATPKSLSGTPTQTVVSDAQGRYTIPGMTNASYDISAAKPGAVKIFTPSVQTVTCNSADVTVPNIVVSIADFAPNSYTLPDALNSLRDVVGLRNPSNTEVLRYDVAPFLNGVPAPDGILDIRDSLNILRMVVGLPPL